MQSMRDAGEKPDAANQTVISRVNKSSPAHSKQEAVQDSNLLCGIMDFIMPVTSDDIFQDMGLPPKPLQEPEPAEKEPPKPQVVKI